MNFTIMNFIGLSLLMRIPLLPHRLRGIVINAGHLQLSPATELKLNTKLKLEIAELIRIRRIDQSEFS